MRAAGDQLCRDAHFEGRTLRHGQAAVRCDGVPLCFHHPAHQRFIVEGLRAAGLCALEQPVIALCIKQPLFVEARFLETVVHIGGEHEIVLVLHQVEQIVVDRLRCVLIAIDINVPAPVGPVLLQRGIGVKPTGVHIGKAVFRGKICKILPETRPVVDEACGGGKPGSGPEHHGVGVCQQLPQLLSLRREDAGRFRSPDL